MKKIVWILHEGNISGANLAALDYANVLFERNYKIIWVLPSKGAFNQLLKNEFYETVVIGFYSWMKKVNSKINYLLYLKQRIRNIWSLWKLIKQIIKEKPDYVFTNTITFSLGALAALLTNKKHYWFIHEFGQEDHGIKVFPFANFGYKFLGRISNKVIVNSEATYNKFSKIINPCKLNIAYYPIRTEKELIEKKSRDGIIRFILIGQIVEGKGHLEVLNAFSKIDKSCENFILNIYGNIDDKDYYQKLIKFIESNNLNSKIIFHPYTTEPLKVIREHDFLIMSSRMEAFGKVTFEALSVGTPVIGKNRGGTKELVVNKYNGFLYENENELIQIFNLIMDNKIDIRNLSDNAFEFIQQKFGYTKTSEIFYQSLNL